MSSFLQEALNYESLGLSLMPIAGNKKPPAGFQWKRYQNEKPDKTELCGWFSNPDLAGLAVILAPVSGGLYMRDFDVSTSYDLWARAFPDLAASLPTAVAHRGPHVYFKSSDTLKTTKLGDGELRGVGAYTVLPPSIHPSGKRYSWRIPLSTASVPTVNAFDVGFMQNWQDVNPTQKQPIDPLMPSSLSTFVP